MRKRYNTPHRSRVVKTRMTEEEYTEFAERLSAHNMSQAEFIRQAITGSRRNGRADTYSHGRADRHAGADTAADL